MGYDSRIEIGEEDGSPQGSPSLLKFPNGSLVDNGDGTFSVDIGSVSQWGDVAGGNYSEFEADGTYKMTGDARTYDDIQVSISSARLPASSAPTWRTFNYGIGGGITFAALGFAIGEYFEFFIQTSHSMQLNTILDNHIHWTIPSDSVDDKISFQLDVIAAGIDENFAVPSGSPFTAEYTLDGTESGKHKLLNIADIPAVNTTLSTAYICRLTRVNASADDYSGEVYVIFNDSHYIKDTIGSREESSK